MRLAFAPLWLVFITACTGGTLTSVTGDNDSDDGTRIAAIDALSKYCFDGEVLDVVEHTDRFFIAGTFTGVGRCTGAGIVLASSGLAAHSADVRDKIEGRVLAAAPDGSGGWFVGGEFELVGSQSRQYLARIDSTGKVTTFNPAPDATVYALTVANGKLYVGGEFSSIAGESRAGIARFNIATGALESWAPSFDDRVSAIHITSDRIFVGGQFITVDSVSNPYLAAFDLTTGTQVAWNPSPSSYVNAITSGSGLIFVGGQFATIDGETRGNLAAFDESTLDVSLTWVANTNSSVKDMLFSNSTLYVVGTFSVVKSTNRKGVAALNDTDGTPTAFDADSNQNLSSLAIANNSVYLSLDPLVGNDYFELSGQGRYHIGAVHPDTGAVLTWAPKIGGRLDVIRTSGTEIFIGGQVGTVDLETHYGLFAVEKSDGSIGNWDPQTPAASEVYDLELVGETLYVGGYFTSIGGQSRNNFAALSASTALASTLNLNPDFSIWGMAHASGALYLFGGFSSIGGASRSGLASLDTTTGTISAWNPSPDASVSHIQVHSSGVYVAGSFNNIGGAARSRLAALDATTGTATTFNPAPTGSINTLDLCGDVLYVGGDFTNIASTARNRIAAFNLQSQTLSTWNPNSSSSVTAIQCTTDQVYVGGGFSSIGGQTRSRFAELDSSSGLATTLNLDFDVAPDRLMIVDDVLGIFGDDDLKKIAGKWRPRGAFLDLNNEEVP